MRSTQDLRLTLQWINVQAFLRVIRAGESSQDDSRAYRMLFGGGLIDDLSAHPNRTVTANGYTSTAAGAYQFLSRTWIECQKALGLTDFSPASQDLAAVYLIERRGALDDVVAGRIEEAIAKCNKEWASLPGSPYGQPTRTLEQALKTYRDYGGTKHAEPAAPVPEEPDTAPASPIQETAMPFPLALITGLLPSVVELIPSLAKIFKPGSAVAERNVAAASVVLDTVVKATNAVNAQDAIEKMRADPTALAAARKEIDSWVDMVESGGGGIDGARKADAASNPGGGMLTSPSFWIAMALLPLVYIPVLSLVGLVGKATWSDDVRAGLVGSLMSAIIGGLVGYYYGQTTTRNRTPAPPGA